MADDDFPAKALEAFAMRPPNMPTEMVLPVQIGMRRAWPYDKRPADGWWHACIFVPPFDEEVWGCDHDHTTEEGAWFCAITGLKVLVEKKADPGDYKWGAKDDAKDDEHV